MEDLKFIQPFLQRATELQNRDPVVAYYCQFYAAKLAIESPTKTPESQAFLMEHLEKLEKVCLWTLWIRDNEQAHGLEDPGESAAQGQRGGPLRRCWLCACPGLCEQDIPQC